MKIAMISLYNPFKKIRSGIESVVYNLAKAFANLGNEVWVVCLGDVREETIENREGVNVWILPDRGKKGEFIRSLLFAKDGRNVIKKLEEKGVRIFYGQAGLSSALTFTRIDGGKKVLTVHNTDGQNLTDIIDCLRTRHYKQAFIEMLKYPLLKVWRTIYFINSDALIFISYPTYNEFKKFYPFIKKRAYVIRNGFPSISQTHFCSVVKKYDFVYVGNIDKRKGVDILILALKLLKEKGASFSAVIVGDGSWKKDTEELVTKLGLTNHIRFLGYLDSNEDVLRVISESKFLVLPSFYEGDSLVVRESLSIGVPVIVSDIPVLLEKVNNNVNGFVFKAGDYIKLATVMEKALHLKPELYTEMVLNAKRTPFNRRWEDVAKCYLTVFYRLLNIPNNG